MSKKSPIMTLDMNLSDNEIHVIGLIIARWGFIDAKIFEQVVLSFDDEEPFPKAMNNAQFSKVLELWIERVARKKDDIRRDVLEKQYEEIKNLSPSRQAIVHSKWEWSPGKLTAVRVHKKNIISAVFTFSDLTDIATRLGQVHYYVSYPKGIEDLSAERMEKGFGISRIGAELLSGQAYFSKDGKIVRKSEET